MNKYTYKTKIDKDGQVCRYRCWDEKFKDMDTNKFVTIKRHRLIKVNGEKVYWIPGPRK